MRRAAGVLVAIGLITGVALTGCKGDPCAPVVERAKECYKKTHKGKQPPGDEVGRFAEICKESASKFQKCLKLKGCDAFIKCASEAGTDPKAKAEYEAKMKKEAASQMTPPVAQPMAEKKAEAQPMAGAGKDGKKPQMAAPMAAGMNPPMKK